MRRLMWVVMCALVAATGAMAQQTIPEKRLVVTRDIDFYGSDLQALFDTDLESCQRVCLNDSACHAFTFNARSNACFPKRSVAERRPYEGAISGIVLTTPNEALTLAEARRQELAFLRPSDFTAALAEARAVGARHEEGEWTIDALLVAARDSYVSGNLFRALHWTGAAVAQSDVSDQWVDYARLNLEYAQTQRGARRAQYTRRSYAAALNGYLRAKTDAARVNALLQMAAVLEPLNRGRDMIPVLRLAEQIRPRDDITNMLDKAIGKYGFRIVEHEVDADSADPRVCAEFSEPLRKAGFDYTPFVRLPSQQLAVEVETRRLCISGVEHGARYKVTFRAGLPAESGETLVKDIPLTLYVGDRKPSVRFPGRGYVLPRSPQAGLPVVTVNLSELDISLRRVSDRNLIRTMQERYFGRPLSQYEERLFSREIAEDVWQGKAEVNNALNKDVTTRLPVGEIVGDLPPGVYVLSAARPNADPYDDPAASQWFVLSDIGLTSLSGTDGLAVVARRLSDAGAVANAEVALVSRANRVLSKTTTDANGLARFEPGLLRGRAGAAPALITVRNNDDFAFLSLTDPAFDLSDRGVAGRPPSGPIDAFLATDRGAYRAGETVHVVALLRDDRMQAVDNVPATAILTRPDGVEYKRLTSSAGAAGGHHFAFPIGATTQRGVWRLSLYADTTADPLASQTVLVEDFVPERIDVKLTLPEGPIRRDAIPTMNVAATYLFGAPGAGLPVEGELRLSALRHLDALPGYYFGRYDARSDVSVRALPSEVRTGADGSASIPLDFPESKSSDQPHELRATIRVREGSGRPVERSINRPIAPEHPIIGIRPEFDGVVPEGTEASFLVQAFSPELKPTDMAVTWTLNRVTTRYQWYSVYGNWNWEPITTRTTVAKGKSTLSERPVRISTPVDWGRYELVIERTDGTYVASSVDFHAGWYAPADASQTPDTLDVSLDKPSYRPGDIATLKIVPRSAGKALVAVLSNRVIAMQMKELSVGENTITLPVTEDWRGGVYVTTQLLSPLEEKKGRNPERSLGLAYAATDPGPQQLDIVIDTPEKTSPRGTLETTVAIDGLQPGETAHVTLAAVDVGILNLTGFQSPDPVAHYFGQRRLGVEIRDLYGRLINGLNGETGRLRSGGDAAAQMRLQSPPPTEELLAQFSGIVETDASGRATVPFDLPEFNGTVRLMALAWTDSAVGRAERDVIVRDPVVIAASLPRFMAPGDTSRLLLDLTHTEGPSGTMQLDVWSDGLDLDTSNLTGTIDLPKGATRKLMIPVRATEIGDHNLSVALTTPDGKRLMKSLSLGVRSNDPRISETRRLTLAPGETLLLNDEVFAQFRPGAEALVSSGPLARFDVPGLLAALDRYPYGCTEQVTSKALPMLYMSSVAEALGLVTGENIDARISQAIEVILSRQAANGAFGLWQPASGDFWLDAYVTDFLSRARAAGHAVPDNAFERAKENLRNRLAYAADFDEGGHEIAYALLVLAREGAASMGDLRYYADVKGDAFSTPMAQAQLAAALALYGDQTRADMMFAKAARKLEARMKQEQNPFWRVDYGTDRRDAAGLLTLAAEVGSNAVNKEELATLVLGRVSRMSTQEQGWILLAANALTKDPVETGLAVNGQPAEAPFVRRVADGAEPQTIRNVGTTPESITITTIGVPSQAAPASGYGYALERDYYNMDGKPVDGPVKVGDRMVTVLTVRPAQTVGARLIVDDPLPAGLEIDNPNLLRSGDIGALGWLKPVEATHAEFRADRFIASVDWNSGNTFRLAYIVRAVSPGSFHHPAASVEDMYRPSYRARTGTGRFVVAE